MYLKISVLAGAIFLLLTLLVGRIEEAIGVSLAIIAMCFCTFLIAVLTQAMGSAVKFNPRTPTIVCIGLAIWIVVGHVYMSHELNPLEERFIQTVSSSSIGDDIEPKLLGITEERDKILQERGYWMFWGGWFSHRSATQRFHSMDAVYFKNPFHW